MKEDGAKLGQCQYRSDQFNWNSNIIPNSSLSVLLQQKNGVCQLLSSLARQF